MSLGSALKSAFLDHRSSASTIGQTSEDKGLPGRVYQAQYDDVFAGAIKAIDDLVDGHDEKTSLFYDLATTTGSGVASHKCLE